MDDPWDLSQVLIIISFFNLLNFMQFRHYRPMASTTPRRPMLSVLHQKTIFFFLFFSFLFFLSFFLFFISFYIFISTYTTNHWRIGLMLHTLLTIRILMKFLQGRKKNILPLYPSYLFYLILCKFSLPQEGEKGGGTSFACLTLCCPALSHHKCVYAYFIWYIFILFLYILF